MKRTKKTVEEKLEAAWVERFSLLAVALDIKHLPGDTYESVMFSKPVYGGRPAGTTFAEIMAARNRIHKLDDIIDRLERTTPDGKVCRDETDGEADESECDT